MSYPRSTREWRWREYPGERSLQCLKKKRQKKRSSSMISRGCLSAFHLVQTCAPSCSWTNSFDLTLASSRALNDVLHGSPYRPTMRTAELFGVEPMVK